MVTRPRYRSEHPLRHVELQPDEERRLRALVHILDYFEDHAPQIPASMIEAFLLVALNEGCSLRDIVELSGRPQSTMSRHLLDLGERNRRMEPGLGLVDWRIAPEELRRKEYYLTPKGRGLLRRILSEKFIEEGKLTTQPEARKLTARVEEKASA
jgi:DNA-binding MarR family transcriptional regulator